jgi:hypothetical protein
MGPSLWTAKKKFLIVERWGKYILEIGSNLLPDFY